MKRSKVFFLLLAAFASLPAQQNAGKGVVTGTVFDASNGQPVRGAAIAINGNSGDLVTDLDGRFRLELSAGQYTLNFRAPNYADATVTEVVVKAGETTEASTVMANANAVTKLDVVETAGAVAATAEAMLTERKLASNVSDSMSNEEIRQGTASDAAGALEKVTGVSIVDNGYVYVRGLGERYSSTMLNNAVLPTTEPEKRVVPLDLFPANLIDNIKVIKTYSPDLPGEFSGGLVQMQTVEFPTERAFRVSMNYGFNTVTSFNRFGGYRGGGQDFFGFDDGTRALPALIPPNDRLFVGRFSDQQFQEFGRAFANNWELSPIDSMRPSQSYSVAGGNSFWKGKLGIVGAITFANQPQRTDSLYRFLNNGGGGRPVIFTNYEDYQTNNESARLGAVMNAAYRFSPAHKITWRNTLTRDTDKEARVFRGYSGGIDGVVESTRLRYIERGMLSTGIDGEHSFSRWKNGLLHWQFTVSRSQRDEPDMRESIRGLIDGKYQFLNLPESGLRFFNKLNDRIYEPVAEWAQPFFKGNLNGLFKFGFRGTFRSRDFGARRFRYFPVRTATLDLTQNTNTLLGAANIRPDGFVVREITRGTDSYDASMDVYGGYAMADMNLSGKLRLVAGLRYEAAEVLVTTLDALVPGARAAAARLSNRDPLPAANLIYQLTARQNLRVGYSRTVNRPDFRELSPFEFTNVVGGYSTVGNPDLRRALINNYDLRWENFLGGNQLVAVSYFFKDFTDPIEQIYRPTASELRQSFLNVAGARNQGVEFEARKNLSFLGKKLRGVAVSGNLTLVSSKVQIPTQQFVQLTSAERPLVGQSRAIFNFTAEWVKPQWRSQSRFYLNHVSRRLTDVGTFQLPDVYQEGNTFLDFVYQYDLTEKGRWSIRFSAENLGNNNYRWTQSDILVRNFRLGRTFSVGTSFNL